MRQSHGGARVDTSNSSGRIARTRNTWRSFFLPLLATLCVWGVALPAPAGTSYVYDANSRLIGVLNGSGNSTRYVYDDIGNLVRTDSIPSSQLMVLGFAPEHGAPGTVVTLWGQGFSATASANAVSFNGTAATVTSSTANQIQTIVPPGATTGAVSITVAGATASGVNAFVVDDTGLAPSVTSVSPTMGAAGTKVTLTGTHLDPVAGETSVTLNGVPVIPTTVTDTTIIFATPNPFGSGKFVVTTPYGQATAGTDFTTIAPDFSSSYTISTGRLLVAGSSVGVKAASASSVIELLFDASAGDWLTLQGSGIPSSISSEVEIYDPRGFLIGPQNYLSSSGPSAPLLRMPESGTYTMVIWPQQAATFNVWVERDAQISTNTTFALATTVNGQSKRLMFNAPTGASFGVGLSGMTVSQTSAEIQYQVLDINGAQLSGGDCQPVAQTTCAINMPAFVAAQGASLPAPGWRQIIFTSDSGTTSKASVVVTQDVSQSLSVGSAATLQLQTVGQNGDQTFTGVAGDYMSLNVSSLSTTPANSAVYFTVYDPTGNSIYNGGSSSTQLMNFPQLTLSGPYTVYVTPYQGVTASLVDTLLRERAVAATPNGSSVSVSTAVGGQNAYVTFQAAQGTSYTVSASCPSSAGDTSISIVDPSGNNAGSGGYCGSSSQSDVVSNAVAGTYTVTLQNGAPFTATVTVTSP